MAETNQGPKDIFTWVPLGVDETFIESEGVKKKVFILYNNEYDEIFYFIGVKI